MGCILESRLTNQLAEAKARMAQMAEYACVQMGHTLCEPEYIPAKVGFRPKLATRCRNARCESRLVVYEGSLEGLPAHAWNECDEPCKGAARG